MLTTKPSVASKPIPSAEVATSALTFPAASDSSRSARSAASVRPE